MYRLSDAADYLRMELNRGRGVQPVRNRLPAPRGGSTRRNVVRNAKGKGKGKGRGGRGPAVAAPDPNPPVYGPRPRSESSGDGSSMPPLMPDTPPGDRASSTTFPPWLWTGFVHHVRRVGERVGAPLSPSAPPADPVSYTHLTLPTSDLV